MTLSLKDIDYESLPGVDPDVLAQKINSDNPDDIITQIVSLSYLHLDYNVLAARLELKQLYRQSTSDFRESMLCFRDELSPAFLDNVNALYEENCEFGKKIIHDRDELFSYSAITLLKSMFLLSKGDPEKNNEYHYERPQHMFMRVAVQLHERDAAKVFETYNLMSLHYYTHATPTIINAGRRVPQLSSCFLVGSPTVDTFFSCMKKCHDIFSQIGGIGVALHKIPEAYFVPCVRILDNVLKLSIHQRNPSCAVFVQVSNVNVLKVLQFKTNTGDSETKARNLHFGLMVSDLFMKRAFADQHWSLFCPLACPGLESVYGEEFEKLYLTYESQHRYAKQLKARDLLKMIIQCEISTGEPYIMYRDTIARQSKYKEKVIECGNLCTEIVEFCSDSETAVCTLASLGLPKFVDSGKFNFQKLAEVTGKIVENLDRVISTQTLPVDDSANKKFRPLGIGISGLGDVFQKLRMPIESPEARELNKRIAKTIHEAADLASWNLTDRSSAQRRHIYLTAYMPTATTALILDNTECFEVPTTNLYNRNLKSGMFQITNKYLFKHLQECGLWNETIRNRLVKDYGSVQNIKEFPHREIYKTAWEIPQKTMVDLAVDRSPYVDQSQSLTIFMANPTIRQVSAMHFYTWKRGLKTGLYYLRTKPGYNPVQFSQCCGN